MSGETYPDPPRVAPAPSVQQPAAIVVDRPADAAAAAAAELDERGDAAPLSAWRLFLQSASGRAGLALFALMLILSAWVLLTYPLDFGSARWSNPAYWANNPRSAPPAWSAAITGKPAVPHTVLDLTEPVETRTIPAGEVRLYQAPIAFTSHAAPESLVLTLSGVTFHSRAPAILISLARPDGGIIRLASVPIRGPRGPTRGAVRNPCRGRLRPHRTTHGRLSGTSSGGRRRC
jgi:hypothetical protein